MKFKCKVCEDTVDEEVEQKYKICRKCRHGDMMKRISW